MGITRILAVYSTQPVMVVLETEEGTVLELCLDELAEVYEYLPPLLWQELVVSRLSGAVAFNSGPAPDAAQ
jgi:hypothetical protein